MGSGTASEVLKFAACMLPTALPVGVPSSNAQKNVDLGARVENLKDVFGEFA